MELQFRKAARRAAPMLISVASVSGGGKTFSALLLAAGIAGKGRVGMLDTENGRGEMYADSPGIVAALPDGYDYSQLSAPFSPQAYIDGIAAAERAGINVLVIDSVTHEYEGFGGVTDIADKNAVMGRANWAKAKKEHKLFVNHLLTTKMDLVFCVRARSKTKIEMVDGKEKYIDIGLQPIQEKNFIFEMLLSLQLEEQTHVAKKLKCPQPLAHLFPGDRLVTREDGEAIAQWNAGGGIVTMAEQVQKRARIAAASGMATYSKFFEGLTKEQRQMIREQHEGYKQTAQENDTLQAQLEASGVDTHEAA